MTVVSYAQANEDLLLFDALREVSPEVGFYIDVGANDPEKDSVTKLFYDQGWRGVNIEPSPEWFARLTEARVRDINIQAVASNRPGNIMFHDVLGEQLGTVVDEYAKRHSDLGKSLRSSCMKTVTLTQICEKHAPKEIHFLKIDVEGHEAEVLEGMDFARFRPWILIIEATEPNTSTPTHQRWDQGVRDAGYHFVFTDILNRYYVANEHAELTSNLSTSAHEYTARRLARLEKERDELAASLRHLEHCFGQAHNAALSPTGAFETHDEVRNILRLLRPYAVRGFDKARFGSANDGGYIHIDDFRGIDTAFSCGIEQNASWDVDVAQRGLTVYQFDHTIDRPPISDNARLIFAKKRISVEAGPDSQSLSSLIKQHDKQNVNPNILLKIDIEGDEWSVFDTTPREILGRYSQIVGEFHYFEGFSEDYWRRIFARVLKKLSDLYAVVHVHANNHAGFSNIANVVVPNVLEITFANRRIYSFTETDEIFPGPLDEPNDPSRPDMYLGSFRF
jgi:FkbM family methyltransferase